MYAHAAVLSLQLRRLGAFFFLMTVLAALCYSVFLLLAVLRTTSLAKTESAIQSTSSELSALESQYLAAEQALTPERARDLGFVTPSASSETFAQAPSRALSLNDGRH